MRDKYNFRKAQRRSQAVAGYISIALIVLLAVLIAFVAGLLHDVDDHSLDNDVEAKIER